MNISQTNSDIHFINFNQDFSCISVGSKHGYRIYNCDPFGKCYTKDQGGVGIVEMLFCTSLVALVGSGDQPQLSPRRLLIKNTKRETTICELTFPTTIYNIKLNRRRMVVVLEEQIYIYDISNMKLMHTIETAPNPKGICTMSSSNDHCYIAYPAPSISSSNNLANGGNFSSPIMSDVMIFDGNSCEAMNIIQAHKGIISCLAINSDGTLLATASEKGTVIRVFSIPSSKKIAQFRRGTYSANINNMTFNMKSTMLLVSSDSDTIHIFRIQDGKIRDQNIATIERSTNFSRNQGEMCGTYSSGIQKINNLKSTLKQDSELEKRSRKTIENRQDNSKRISQFYWESSSNVYYTITRLLDATTTFGIKEQDINKNKIMGLHSQHNKYAYTELSLKHHISEFLQMRATLPENNRTGNNTTRLETTSSNRKINSDILRQYNIFSVCKETG
ncbi:hypothetical protein BB561_005184 [Smittium simulii]|uniref:Autophagy-related protein 18 n=1 Tax=Smittium simulii TaxID=133385 RepID=A0A2T9YBN2_9FUNG|nr:hypothetical protein BB561_005184 [Smittium simulii]